jgi:hypothetical protein
MKRIVCLVVFALASTIVLPHALPASALIRSVDDPVAGVIFMGPGLGRTGDAYALPDAPDSNGVYYGKWCLDGLPGFDGVGNLECGIPGYKLKSLANSMAPCSVDNSVSCIQNIEMQSGAGNWISGNYAGQPATPLVAYSAYPQLDVGPSSTGALFEFDSGSSKEMVLLSIQYRKTFNYSYFPNIQVQINPTKFVSGLVNVRDYFPYSDTINPCLLPLSDARLGCWRRTNVPHRYRLTLKLLRKPSGWVNTQIGDALFQITKPSVNGSGYVVTLEGDSVEVPQSAALFRSSSPTDVNAICAVIRWSAPGFCGSKAPIGEGISNYMFDTLDGLQYPVEKFSQLLRIKPELDKPLSEATTWRASLDFNDAGRLSNCAEQGVNGLVGGNALAINASLPKWNISNSSLEYKVASPHFRADGEVATGIYELQVNEKVAKCLWGVSLTPQNVQLSVVDADGNAKVAVAVLSVYGEMVKFRATGFTYSTATLRLSLKKSSKQSGLVCIKGTSKRTLKPSVKKCPTGCRKEK